MNLSKQQLTIVGVVIALVAIWYFFLRKKAAESSYGPMGGMYSHFGNETGFATPGSGYGLNNLENGYTAPRPVIKDNKFVCPSGYKWSNADRKCVPGGFM